MTGAPPIELIPIGVPEPPRQILDGLATGLAKCLGTRVTRGPALDVAVDEISQGGTVSADTLLDLLLTPPIPHRSADSWVLGITRFDLTAPGHSFVFGVATVGGRWAVLSSARLMAGDDPEIGPQRLLKEAVHELGHVAGLEHCERPDCVMHPSRSVAEVDTKSVRYCSRCEVRLTR